MSDPLKATPGEARIHGTTVLALRHRGRTAVAGDGQVTLHDRVLKQRARKVRRIYNDRIVVGFAGATADALSLSERLQEKLERYNGNLPRAAAELARDWRTDKVLRRLEAVMVAADESHLYVLSGSGDVIEPDDGVIGIGSGGAAAQAAAVALMRHSELDARRIAEEAVRIAAGICVYTNEAVTVEEIG